MLNFIHPFSVVSQNEPAFAEPKTLIAHELAHSWAGDSATLATWNDVWLNEGITSYLANRIMEEVAGTERAELLWFQDRRNFAGFVQNVEDPLATVLHREVPHPWIGFGAAGYVKGSLFIRTIEDSVGREAFDAFLRQYFGAFSYRWVDDLSFLEFLRERLLADEPALETALRLQEWIYQPGLPSNVSAPVTSAVFDRVLSRAGQFASGTPVAMLEPSTWRDYELELFLQLAAGAIRTRMAEVDATLALSSRTTPPTTWLGHAIAVSYEPAFAGLERVLARGGSSGTVLSLFSALAANPALRPHAVELFTRYRDRYDVFVQNEIAEMLGLAGARAAA